MENTEKNYDLTSFKRANSGMIATNDTYKSTWGVRSSVVRVRDYKIEEIDKTKC